MKINKIFHEYGNNPVTLFGHWFAEAEASESVDYNAMFLATANKAGKPSVRPVLLKSFDERGFVFFTDYEGGKGRNLAENPYAETVFHWRSLMRQVRIAGPVEKTSAAESDAYFKTRARGKQIGVWASAQSQTFEQDEELDKRVKGMTQRFEGQDIPRPPRWGGFRILPERMEFWIERENRLHTRFVYLKAADGWQASWLFP